MSNQSLQLIGMAFTDVLSAGNMRDFDNATVLGMMMVNALRANGLTIVDHDRTDTLPVLDAHMAARVQHEMGYDTLELEVTA
jgi:hypothetical protein